MTENSNTEEIVNVVGSRTCTDPRAESEPTPEATIRKFRIVRREGRHDEAEV